MSNSPTAATVIISTLRPENCFFGEGGLILTSGTGHGVGFLGSVHERPNRVRWRVVPERQDNAVFEEGMITSDEPGLYFEGKFGIRTENLMLCVKAEE